MRHQRGKGGSWLGSGFPRAVLSVMLFIKTSVRKWKLPDRRGLGLPINKGDTRKITWPRGDRKYYIYQRFAEYIPYIRFISCCYSCQIQKCSVNIYLIIILSTKWNCFLITLKTIFYSNNFKIWRNNFQILLWRL